MESESIKNEATASPKPRVTKKKPQGAAPKKKFLKSLKT